MTEETTENENVLLGMRCPRCGSAGPFRIAARCWAEVHDNGIEHSENFSWDDDDTCMCVADAGRCAFSGHARDFRSPWHPYPEMSPEIDPAEDYCGAFFVSHRVLFRTKTRAYTGRLKTYEDDESPPRWEMTGPDGYDVENVTHWMPIPL